MNDSPMSNAHVLSSQLYVSDAIFLAMRLAVIAVLSLDAAGCVSAVSVLPLRTNAKFWDAVCELSVCARS